MGITRSIKDTLVTVIAAIQNGGEPAFVEVLDNTSGSADGYPMARLLPKDTPNIIATNVEQERTADFALLMHVNLDDTTESEQAAYNTLYDLMDLTLDTLDSYDHQNGTLGQVLAGAYILQTTMAGWEVLTIKDNAVIQLRLDISVRYSKSLA